MIATEHGWNLYVGGNGGATPAARRAVRHRPRRRDAGADDRPVPHVLRPVRRSPERTAPWIDGSTVASTTCESVIVDDSLGICDELDAVMARHVEVPPTSGEATLATRILARFVDVRERPTTPTPASCSCASAARSVRPATTSGRSWRDHLPTWTPVCALDALTPDRGVAALVDGEPVAVFRLSGGDEQVVAIGNVDPFSGASVLSRGIIGSRGDTVTVASPVYKQRFDVHTGACVDDAAVRVTSYDVTVVDGVVHVGPAREVSVSLAPLGIPDRGHGRPQGRGAGDPARAPWRHGRVGGGAVARAQPRRPRRAAGRDQGGRPRPGRPVPRHHRHRHEDLALGGRGSPGCTTTWSLRSARRRSWPAARRASACCGPTACASCGRPSRSASRTCSPTSAAAT